MGCYRHGGVEGAGVRVERLCVSIHVRFCPTVANLVAPGGAGLLTLFALALAAMRGEYVVRGGYVVRG